MTDIAISWDTEGFEVVANTPLGNQVLKGIGTHSGAFVGWGEGVSLLDRLKDAIERSGVIVSGSRPVVN